MRFVDDPDQVAEAGPDLILVDLDRCPVDAMVDFCVTDARVIGFGPHVDSERHDRALTAGFNEVLARSVFFKRLPRLLREADGERGTP